MLRYQAKSALQKMGLLPAAREVNRFLKGAIRLSHLYSGLVSTRANDIARIRATLGLLEPQAVVDFKKIRVGAGDDGGYVMVDDFAGISAALSLGVGCNMTWDISIAERGIPVLQFDDGIGSAPAQQELCKFWRRKIVATKPSSQSEITIAGILLENNLGRSEDLILKIDIEGAEWEIFSNLDDGIIKQFRQIICEFHDFHRIYQTSWRLRAYRVLEKLKRNHCVVHIHGNNYGRLIFAGDVRVPEVLEVTFVRRKDYATSESSVQFPTELDGPNNRSAPDIFLGNFHF
jgi:Methyltransferase FkbM domain